MKLTVLVLMFFLQLIQFSIADEMTGSQQRHTLYFGFGAGDSDLSIPGDPTESYDNKLIQQVGYRYRINSIFSFDGRFINNSSTKLSNTADSRDLDLDFYALTMAATAELAITDNSFLFANLGLNNYQWSYNGFRVIDGDILVDDRKKNSGNKLFYTMGYKYNFSEFEVSIERQWFDMDGLDLTNNAISVGYRF